MLRDAFKVEQMEVVCIAETFSYKEGSACMKTVWSRGSSLARRAVG
jgi:hypothetical protein